ncbi:phosphatase [Natranaerobius thermophilus]|uniref:PHP domain protein n=1 Tax=Natranaerobius thermophilus (strain ATCC BAA-1301 / DSM 18059 / JW/NM-WN-LF) TaxID=457570 RepID=B2A704_NATTJ|nr:phosphatase [Natranaerobius thermophilus]ACB85595.1 PHP domain protein [Natranaerobius thermophilus JW/NM-WN-LF]
MKLEADLHIHTIASGHAYSTVKEIAEAASRKSLKLIALTDHGPAMPGGPHLYHFGNLRVLPGELQGVEMLHGVEANIIDHEGNLDVPERYLHQLDWIAAGFHPVCYPGGNLEENTKAMIRALENPFVDVVVHPGNPQFRINEEKIVKVARDLGKLLELNNSSLTISREGSEENCELISSLTAQFGGRVVINSDAHFAEDVGSTANALKMAMDAGVTEDQIVNSSVAKVKEFLAERGRE